MLLVLVLVLLVQFWVLVLLVQFWVLVLVLVLVLVVVVVVVVLRKLQLPVPSLALLLIEEDSGTYAFCCEPRHQAIPCIGCGRGAAGASTAPSPTPPTSASASTPPYDREDVPEQLYRACAQIVQEYRACAQMNQMPRATVALHCRSMAEATRPMNPTPTAMMSHCRSTNPWKTYRA